MFNIGEFADSVPTCEIFRTERMRRVDRKVQHYHLSDIGEELSKRATALRRSYMEKVKVKKGK